MAGAGAGLAAGREEIIRRLAADLVGPGAAEEALRSRPADVYLTGILWPRNTEVSAEDDERLAVAPGAGEEGEESGDEAQPRVAHLRRPSNAGLSFAARSEQRDPQVRVRVSFAMYSQDDQDGVTVWRRQPVTHTSRITLTPGELDPVKIGPPGVVLKARTIHSGEGLLSTVTLVNGATASADRIGIESATLFQVELEVTPEAGTELVARPSRRAAVDDDDRSAALLYRDAHEFAAGHNCSADWNDPAAGSRCTSAVRIAWLPEAVVPAVSPAGHAVFQHLADADADPLAADWLARADATSLAAALARLCDAYQRWITLMEQKKASELSPAFQETAARHLREATAVLQRVRAGVQRLATDPMAAAAFRLANLAMSTQARWGGKGALRWRPFQLGFVLLALESSIDPRHDDRGVMDLLWFPTGGGKTEAYLALIALVAFFRRLSAREADQGAGVAVIMRYTLRLLTTQQFVRAAAMICACEAIRSGRIVSPDAGRLGQQPFSIALWVGEGATPNSRKLAFDSWNDPSKASPPQLLACPCCGKPLRYSQVSPSHAVEVRCEGPQCVLTDAPLPVWTVDEDIYAFRPTLLIGTIDKFAQIVRNPQTAPLFGVGTGAQPQLIVQDELHLISGPLGTMAGLYESALDLILSADGVRPKIIGSTATIRRASEQVLALFDRRTCQFPPPGLDAEDSGFSVLDRTHPGRKYVGVTGSARSAKFMLLAVAASLLQSARAGLTEEQRDPYWTLLAYFNSLRELGGALVVMQDDVNDMLRILAQRRGESARSPGTVEELTSRRTQREVRDMLEQLAISAGQDGALDVVLATNMVSVGVDIPRLGLMLVNGQPKTMAEYIQATSRVGRGRVAGLVVPVLNVAKPRDRSHYETFRTWHGTLYREVEATSVTPFASRARDRALHAVLVAVVRHLLPRMLDSPELNEDVISQAQALIERIAARAERVDQRETSVKEELLERLRRWERRKPRQYWAKPAESLLQGAENAAARRAIGGKEGQAWPTPNTMRGVEPAVDFRLVARLAPPPPRGTTKGK